jgi:hypothetical protein
MIREAVDADKSLKENFEPNSTQGFKSEYQHRAGRLGSQLTSLNYPLSSRGGETHAMHKFLMVNTSVRRQKDVDDKLKITPFAMLSCLPQLLPRRGYISLMHSRLQLR